jgi:hypothetical protein
VKTRHEERRYFLRIPDHHFDGRRGRGREIPEQGRLCLRREANMVGGEGRQGQRIAITACSPAYAVFGDTLL